MSPARRRPRTTITLSCENLDCKKPQSFSLTASEFEDWIEDGEFNCAKCKHELSVDGLTLRCYICQEEIDYESVSQVPGILEDRCPWCAGSPTWDADFYSIVVDGSWSAEYGMYDWIKSTREVSELARPGRTDYWEGIVHFCDANEFITIYKELRIKACATGLYGSRSPEQSKAVCLSEAPASNWAELKEIHGEYGFVFRKSDIIGLGGAPAIYLPQSVVNAIKEKGETIPVTLWPYLNTLKLPRHSPGKKHDFLHEREWRVPCDINFRKVAPFAVTFPRWRPRIEDEELILRAASEFQELSTHGFGKPEATR